MRNERAWPQQCWKSCANGSNIVVLRFGAHGTKEMLGVVGWNVWPVSNFAQEHATTSNNMQQGVQTDATSNIQQCWELLANNVASVCFTRQETIKNNNTEQYLLFPNSGRFSWYGSSYLSLVFYNSVLWIYQNRLSGAVACSEAFCSTPVNKQCKA